MPSSRLSDPWPAWSPAQIAALAFGLWWIGNGAAVFLTAEPSIGSLEASGSVDALGLSIAVNGWHGLFHLATGFAGVAASRSPRGSATYVLLVGALYLAAACCSLITGATVFGLIRVDEFGSADHAAEGIVLIMAWLGSRRAMTSSPPEAIADQRTPR
jgi:hypothetical protein